MSGLNNWIYSSVPDDHIDRGDWSGEKKRMENLLRNNKGEMMTASKIATICEFKKTGTNVEVRKAITELIEDDRLPIIATSKGFTWATSKSMVGDYVDSLETRKKGLDRRIDAVRAIHALFQEDQDG